MAIFNPGSLHFDADAGASGYALINYSDYPNAATTISSLSNDPAKVSASADD